MRSRFALEVRCETQAESIDPRARKVALRDLNSYEIQWESYDKLILATGAAPLRPPLEGLDLTGVFQLRNLEDTDQIHEFASTAKTATVVGGGFIGLEMVENLRRGIKVTLVELAPQLLPASRSGNDPTCAGGSGGARGGV